jgi:predicted nucleic acid-binding protein
VSYIVVDTDVASAILKGQLTTDLASRLAGQQLATTFVTVGELTQWTFLHRWGARRRAGLQAFFASVVVLPCSFHAATVWARFKLTLGYVDGQDRSTTPGSPPAASPAIFRSRRSTPRTTPTSPSTGDSSYERRRSRRRPVPEVGPQVGHE